MSELIARFIIRYRLFWLIAVLASTGFFAWHALRVRVESPTIDLFPTNHEFVETFREYAGVFGGATTVVMMLEVEEGDIFNPETLGKIRDITRRVLLLRGVNNYQVLSLAQRKVRNIRVDEETGYTSDPIMWPEIPETEEEIEDLIAAVRSNPRYNGKIVSLDGKAALILAGFIEDRLEPLELYQEINEIAAAAEDENTTIHIIGRPVMLGHILHEYPQLIYLFVATLVAMFLMLFMYFRDARGVMVPMLTAILSAFWGLGFLSLLDYNFDPLIIVVPFIISARALSHSVQLINRYLSEYDRHHDRKKAAEATFAGLFKPGLLAIVTDAVGVLVVFLTPIPLMQKLAVMGGFWVMSIIVTDLLFNPIFLSYLPPPKRKDTGRGGLTERALRFVGYATAGGHVWKIVGVTAVLFVIGFLFARNLVIGDVHPGTPMLWPDSQYNRSTDAIAQQFGNTVIFNVIVEGQTHDAIRSPEVLTNMEGLQRAMEALPVVSDSFSIADLLPGIIAAIHGGNPKWELIPLDRRESGFFLSMIFSGSEPGDLTEFVTPDSRDANIRVFLHDHKGTTLQQVVATARDYIENNPFPMARLGGRIPRDYEAAFMRFRSAYFRDRAIEASHALLRGDPEITGEDVRERILKHASALPLDRARFRLAAGYGGLVASVNEVIVRTEAQVTGLAFLVVFLFCTFAYRSVVAGILFLIPLAVTNYMTYALMGALRIGLDVNSLPVMALGVGLGVNYGLYVAGRIEEEFRRSQDLAFAIMEALSTAGKAVFFTAGTMSVGVVFWAWSFLRFQAEMGLLLVFWMIASMLGGLVLLPTLIWIFKPRFLVKRNLAKT